MKKLNILISLAAATAFATFPAFAHEGETHEGQAGEAAGEEVSVSGEVVDMVCYIDHNAYSGTDPKHVDCAKKCVNLGLPVGLKADDGKTYLLIGQHKPINSELVQYAAKKITVEGKVTSRDGVNMIENAVIQK